MMIEDIPAELIINWDQTGIKAVNWGSKRVEVAGVKDKQTITAVFAGSLVGDFFPVQMIH